MALGLKHPLLGAKIVLRHGDEKIPASHHLDWDHQLDDARNPNLLEDGANFRIPFVIGIKRFAAPAAKEPLNPVGLLFGRKRQNQIICCR